MPILMEAESPHSLVYTAIIPFSTNIMSHAGLAYFGELLSLKVT